MLTHDVPTLSSIMLRITHLIIGGGFVGLGGFGDFHSSSTTDSDTDSSSSDVSESDTSNGS